MKIVKSLKFVLFPSTTQKELINKTFGCCRQIYNNRLAERINFYNNNIATIPQEQRTKEITNTIWKTFKPTTEREMCIRFPYMREVSNNTLQQSRIDCEKAFTNFYNSKSGKRKGIQIGFPKYKTKKHSRQSYRNFQIKIRHFNFEQQWIQIPKLGKVKFKLRKLPKWFDLIKDICFITVNKSPAHRYYVSITFELSQEYRIDIEHSNDVIGLDFDCDDMYIDSNGKSATKDFGFIKQKQTHNKRLTKLSRRFNRKQKIQSSLKKIDSNNRYKAKIKLARYEEYIANKRKDWIEKETLRLVKTYNKIVVEDLNIQGMLKGSRNAKNYVDISWAIFVSKLQDKGQTYGCEIVKADRFFASSQLCSSCGFKYPEVRDRHLDKWTYPQCNTVHQRDVNAAINLKNYIPLEGRELTTVES